MEYDELLGSVNSAPIINLNESECHKYIHHVSEFIRNDFEECKFFMNDLLNYKDFNELASTQCFIIQHYDLLNENLRLFYKIKLFTESDLQESYIKLENAISIQTSISMLKTCIEAYVDILRDAQNKM